MDWSDIFGDAKAAVSAAIMIVILILVWLFDPMQQKTSIKIMITVGAIIIVPAVVYMSDRF